MWLLSALGPPESQRRVTVSFGHWRSSLLRPGLKPITPRLDGMTDSSLVSRLPPLPPPCNLLSVLHHRGFLRQRWACCKVGTTPTAPQHAELSSVTDCVQQGCAPGRGRFPATQALVLTAKCTSQPAVRSSPTAHTLLSRHPALSVLIPHLLQLSPEVQTSLCPQP